MNFYKVKSLIRSPDSIRDSQAIGTLSYLKSHIFNSLFFSFEDEGKVFLNFKNILYCMANWITISIFVFYVTASIYKAFYPNQPQGVSCLAEFSLSFFSSILVFYVFVTCCMFLGYVWYGESLLNSEQQVNWIMLHSAQYLIVILPFLAILLELGHNSSMSLMYQLIMMSFLIFPSIVLFVFFLICHFIGCRTLVTVLALSVYTFFLFSVTSVFNIN